MANIIKEEKVTIEFTIDIPQCNKKISKELDLEYREIGKEGKYQTEIILPFYAKGSLRKVKSKDLSKHAKETLNAVLRQKYKSILLRDYNHRKHFQIFKNVLEEALPKKLNNEEYQRKYSNGLNHQETILNVPVQNIIDKISSKFKKATKLSDIPDDFDFQLSWKKFLEMLVDDNCEYCDININKIYTLATKEQLFTKRARGYSLEVDQKDPYAFYSDTNCVASCYWCNNAKTDEFTYTEFKENIAQGIKESWESRLKE